MNTDATKTCPFCGEEIAPVAVKCRFCKEMLPVKTENPESKACPFCGEEIKTIAVKCRFCGEALDKTQLQSAKVEPTFSASQTVPSVPIPSLMKRKRTTAIVIAATILLLAAGGAWFFIFRSTTLVPDGFPIRLGMSVEEAHKALNQDKTDEAEVSFFRADEGIEEEYSADLKDERFGRLWIGFRGGRLAIIVFGNIGKKVTEQTFLSFKKAMDEKTGKVSTRESYIIEPRISPRRFGEDGERCVWEVGKEIAFLYRYKPSNIYGELIGKDIYWMKLRVRASDYEQWPSSAERSAPKAKL